MERNLLELFNNIRLMADMEDIRCITGQLLK